MNHAQRLAQGELIGYPIQARHCTRPYAISGTVRDETKHTLLIEVPTGEFVRILKSTHTLTLHQDDITITITGSFLTHRPEDRHKLLAAT